MKTKSLAILLGLLSAIGPAALIAGSGRVELILSGPVESVDAASRSVTVLNHRISVVDVSGFGVGTLVNVYGGLQKNSAVSNAVVENLSRYASGSDQVFLKGAISAMDSSTGRISVGGAVVDYTALLATSGFRVPRLGATVEVSGTQPGIRGAVLATRLLEVIHSAGVVGSGATSSGVVGSGVASSGVVGSGAVSSGVVGSGVVSSGVVGSGVVSSGVVGSGATSSGVVGSGRGSTGVVGSGAVSSGVVGSGATSSGVVGSGRGSTGVVGSGVVSSGVVGSGATSSGVVGSGRGSTGVVGSGATSSGVVGSGATSSGVVGSGRGSTGVVGSGATAR